MAAQQAAEQPLPAQLLQCNGRQLQVVEKCCCLDSSFGTAERLSMAAASLPPVQLTLTHHTLQLHLLLLLLLH